MSASAYIRSAGGAHASAQSRDFCTFLREDNRLSSAALERAERVADESVERIEAVLTRLGLISERDLAQAFADFLQLPLAKPSDYPVIPLLEDRLSLTYLRNARVLPLFDRGESLAIAMLNPLDTATVDAVRFAAGREILPFVAYPADFEAAFERLYSAHKPTLEFATEGDAARGQRAASDDIDRLQDSASEAPVILFVNQLIARAIEMRASDIHIEPMENELRVRYRIDGVLRIVQSPPSDLAQAVISRVKIMAKLNIAERRLAQDGRVRLAVRGKEIDFRISTTPTIHGESVVLRILDRSQLALDFNSLGFDDKLTSAIRQLLAEPHGIVLVTGPTGSGKTTTLYTALLELNTPEKKILTIEEPVEYQLAGINQVQVKPEVGRSFANALRSFLRQDPDIMMIGEIRDLETAQIAVQAALTGHLILSTLHTNDAAGAVTRLLDMGVEDYLLTSTLNGIIAQRLVRLLCVHCREPYEILPELLVRLGISAQSLPAQAVLYHPVGCRNCNGTGFLGRGAIVEILRVTDTIRRAILARADAAEIGKLAEASAMETMAVHGLRRALLGETTLEEVLRVTRAS